ncbi:MAG: MarR family winged helix-turn-helix transcriptional regulator [Caulobacter sp.]
MDSGVDQQIIAWAQALEAYARDWDDTFENRPGYFTQEFWYLLVGCLIANWRGRPMTMSQACQAMKSGSNRTREERIKKAVDDGFLTKERAGDDGRAALVRPTPKLEALMVGHLRRTREIVSAALAE